MLFSRLLLGISLFAASTCAVNAAPFTTLSGGLTFNAIVDPTFNFAAVDFRGTVGLGTPDGAVVLTDIFSNSAFGNLTLLAVDPAFNGSGVNVTLLPATFVLSNNGTVFAIMSSGFAVNPPLSAPVTNFLAPLLFIFSSPVITPIAGSPNVLVQYSLLSVTPESMASTPEPATLGLAGLSIVALMFGARRRAAVRG